MTALRKNVFEELEKVPEEKLALLLDYMHSIEMTQKTLEPNAVTLAAMEAAERDEDIYGPFDSMKELMEALNAET